MFLHSYVNFFGRPLLFIYFYNFVAKMIFCHIKKFPHLIKTPTVYVCCFLIAMSSLFEKDKRVSDLFIYMLPWIIEAKCTERDHLKNENKPVFKGKVQRIGFALAVGLLVRSFQSSDFLRSSNLLNLKILFPFCLNN